MLDQIKNKLIFLEELNKFKLIERTMGISGRTNYETDAEHSWHLSIFAMLFAPLYPELDVDKCIKFAIIHDLPEIYAGDVVPRGDISNKKQKEHESINKLLSLLDIHDRTYFENLFHEYENKTSKEARFVYELDKVIPSITQYLCQGVHLKKNKVKYEDCIPIQEKKISDEFGLKEIWDYYVDMNKKNGYFYLE